ARLPDHKHEPHEEARAIIRRIAMDYDRLANGHGVGHAELVTDFRSSTFAFVLRRSISFFAADRACFSPPRSAYLPQPPARLGLFPVHGPLPICNGHGSNEQMFGAI